VHKNIRDVKYFFFKKSKYFVFCFLIRFIFIAPSVKYGPSGWSDPNEELPFSWNQPPQRYRYEDRTRRYNRAHFNYAGEAKKEDNLPYTKDGAIDWTAIKATYDEQPNYRQSYRDGENAYNRGGKYRTPYEEPDVYNMADFYNPGRNLFSKRAGGLKLAGVVPNDGYSRGVGTFYDLETHKGVCGQQYKNDQLVAATKLENKDLCGKKVEVTGPNNSTIEVTIVDGCKTCESNDLDLSPAGNKNRSMG
jgi:hypothetical protein